MKKSPTSTRNVGSQETCQEYKEMKKSPTSTRNVGSQETYQEVVAIVQGDEKIADLNT